MAVKHDPIVKKCRYFDISPAVLGYDKKKTNRNPGAQNRRKKLSEYGAQLRETQKLKFVYGVLEKPFANYYRMAAKMEGMAGENLISLLERRFDNVVFRMGMAKTRREARQLVTHGHFTVNGKNADIPSLLLKVGDVVTVKETSKKSPKIKSLMEEIDTLGVPGWLDVNAETCTATLTAAPKKEDVDFPIEEHLVVEWYSRRA